MAATAPLRLGFIGAGTIGRIHMDCFGQLPGVELAAVADASPAVAAAAAQLYSAARVYAHAEDLVADRTLDAVVIGVPNLHHDVLAVAALREGKHVFVEKPMAINSRAAKAIVRAQRETGRVLLVGHQMRWETGALAVKEQVAKGAFGRIYNAKTGWWRRKGIPGWGTWFTRADQSGGGPLVDIGVHMLDLALWLMGNPKPTAVYGSVYAKFGPRKRGIGDWGRPDWNGVFDVEDLATALIRLEDGSTLSMEVSWAVNMDTDNQPFVHLMGAEGGATLRGNRATLLAEHFDRPMDVAVSPPATDEGPRVRIARHFLDCIRNGAKPQSDAESGLANNLVIDAIYESSRTGREVILDYGL
jgi:predicted dehydrogenase